MTHHPDDLAAGAVPLHAPGAAIDRNTNPRDPAGRAQDSEAGNVAVATWEDEGGHFPALRSVALNPAVVSPLDPDALSASEGLLAMQARFVSDFADGLMGRHHNSFQHRSRVLRRLAGAGRLPEPGPGRH